VSALKPGPNFRFRRSMIAKFVIDSSTSTLLPLFFLALHLDRYGSPHARCRTIARRGPIPTR
jgi:hypothetical protein